MPNPTSEPVSDPFERVRALGERDGRAGGALGLFLACSTHVAVLICALTLFQETRALAATTSELAIEVAEPTALPPPPPPPQPEPFVTPPPPEPVPQPPPPKADSNEKEDPYEEDDSPPPPAEAAKVLTAPELPSEPPAPPEDTFAVGEGTGLGVGLVAGAGTGDATTFDPRAQVGNKAPTKRREAKPDAPQAYPDLSRPASPFYGMASGCEFPDGVDGETAVVPIIVTVGPDGKAIHVEVVSDPGSGFGAAAKRCAMRLQYRAGREASGRLILSKTPLVRMRFTR